MSGLLENLRSKPAETRKRFALGTSVTFTGIIFVMWLTVFNHGPLNNSIDSDLDVQRNQTASPLSAFSSNAASAFQQLRNGFSSTTDAAATGTQSQQSTTSDSVDTQNPPPAATNNSPDAYWSDQNFTDTSSEMSQDSTSVKGVRAENRTPFNSRNYNPHQEFEWFIQ